MIADSIQDSLPHKNCRLWLKKSLAKIKEFAGDRKECLVPRLTKLRNYDVELRVEDFPGEDYKVLDVHTSTKKETTLEKARTVLRGGFDISIGPSRTGCVYLKTKKPNQVLNESQAKGELFIANDAKGPFSKKAKFMEEVKFCDERMLDIIPEMSDDELSRMKLGGD
ncbi:12403_t:CDS:2 [Funneliformis geosporum]|nr:12403_t:CDS:2 [Funneliformis geosporum]